MTLSSPLSARTVAASAAVLLAGTAFAGTATADPGKGHGKGDGKAHEQRQDQRHGSSARPASKPAAHPAGQGGSGDPAGNNGTFKVDGLPYSDGMANEPHVSCGFRLKFFGFDEGQTGDITIAGQAPSGSGVVSSRTGVLISDDAAGGGPNDPDAVVEYTASDLNLAGLTAQPQQGYHLKVTLSTDAPGGVKHKVFWYEPCATAPEVGGTEQGVTPVVGGTEVTTETRSGGTTTVPTQVLGVKMNRANDVAADRTEVLGTSMSRSGGLPFTGAIAGLLAAIGAGIVAFGAVVLLAARRARHVA